MEQITSNYKRTESTLGQSPGNYGNFLSVIVTPLSQLLREMELFPRISGAGQHCSRRKEVPGPERWERGQRGEGQG